MRSELQQPASVRFLTCGSVDDGKSTLLGRLLVELDQVPDDQLASIRAKARDGHLDYAWVLDGLEAEREQGITIDVAYRYFRSGRRSFIAADCPGHEQYTRNMACGAAGSDVAIVLVDARKGLQTQSFRHSLIAHRFGVSRIIVAVNKMDALAYGQAQFDSIANEYLAFAKRAGIVDVHVLPVAALYGVNLVDGTQCAAKMPWYQGPCLLELLEQSESRSGLASAKHALAMPVQWVCRAGQDFRGYAGTIGMGSVVRGQAICVHNARSVQRAIVKSLSIAGRQVERASAGDAVMVELDRELDISRGDVLAQASAAVVEKCEEFVADVLCLESELRIGQRYQIQIGTQQSSAVLVSIESILQWQFVDETSSAHSTLSSFQQNQMARVRVRSERGLCLQRFENGGEASLSTLLLIDPINRHTAGVATIFGTGSSISTDVHWQPMHVSRAERAQQKAQKACCIWFTGLSGAGKSTLAAHLDRKLTNTGRHVFVLDGDNVRHGLNRNLGFSAEDRRENIRRVSETAKLMVDAGLIVLVSLISPFRSEREHARALFAPGEFFEVFVDTPLSVAEQRDTKGLYAKARAGLLPGMTGIDAPYEAPLNADLHLRGDALPVERALPLLLALISD